MPELEGRDQYPPISRRIVGNRLKIALVILFSVVALAPFVLGIAYFGAAGMARMSGNRADAALLWRIMPLTGGVTAALLALLLWATASSPTTRLLAESAATPAGDGQAGLLRLLESVSARAGVPVPKLYILPSNAPNLLCGGSRPDNAVMGVTRGALALFDEREQEALLAHGVSHIANYDIRLNAAVASVAAFLQVPFRVFRVQVTTESRYGLGVRRRLGWILLAVSPVGLYIFFVAPLVGLLMRTVASRELEFAADRDAALLAKGADGLLSVLAKIGGAHAAAPGENPVFAHCCFANPQAYGWARGDFRAKPPRLSQRLDRLAQGAAGADLAKLQAAVEMGKLYGRRNPSMNEDHSGVPGVGDEFAGLMRGTAMGRVHRVLSAEPVAVYESERPNALVAGWLKPGSLFVLFDAPGRMRQVNTPEEQYGYIDRKVKVKAVDGVLPQEVYDPKLRAAAEASLPERQAAAGTAKFGLSQQQIFIVLGVTAAVFIGGTLLLVVFAGK
jgi:heat shock protein HtpX